MTYQALVVNVVTASPGDVSQEKRIVEGVIHEWNANNSRLRRLVLMPIGWQTHSTPEMGDRPQAILNRQLLSDCDILVAMFWTRLGSPTGAAPSGTVEEIEEQLAAGKPVLLYFSSVPVRLDSVDNRQYEALVEFKESCRQRGLFAEYQDLTEFRDKFRNDLARTVNRLFPNTEEVSQDQVPPPPSLSPEAIELLAEAVKDRHGIIMKLATLGGTHIQTNNRQFVELGNPRSEARWRRAVDELETSGLIEDRGGKGEVFSLTDAGYKVADAFGAA
jgi:hypothetical protein